MKPENNFWVVPRGVEITETGLTINAPLSYAEWESLGFRLQRAHRSILWILGDWLVWGQDHFNEEFSQAIEARGYSVQTLLNAQWVASRVAPRSRRRELSWSHHLEIASLPVSDQDKFLQEAVDQDWGVRELRDAVREFKGRNLVREGQAEMEVETKNTEDGMQFNFEGWETSTLLRFGVHVKACWDSSGTANDSAADGDFVDLMNAITSELQRRKEFSWVEWIVDGSGDKELGARLSYIDGAFTEVRP